MLIIDPYRFPPTPPSADLILLLSFDGSNGSTTFTDESSYGHVFSSTGAVLSTSGPKFGTAALQCASSDSAVISATGSSPLQVFDGDFTIECWFKSLNPTINQCIWDWGGFNGAGGIRLYTNGGVVTCNSGIVGWPDLANSTPISANTWYHAAVVRHGNEAQLYINGVSTGPANNTWSDRSSLVLALFNGVSLGTSPSTATPDFTGQIDEMRVMQGAVYLSDFTAPSAAFTP